MPRGLKTKGTSSKPKVTAATGEQKILAIYKDQWSSKVMMRVLLIYMVMWYMLLTLHIIYIYMYVGRLMLSLTL